MHHHCTLNWMFALALLAGAACGGSVEPKRNIAADAVIAAANPTPSSGSSASGGGGATVVGLFPGAGTSNAAAPLAGGSICDAVGARGSMVSVNATECFFGSKDSSYLVAALEQVLECAEDTAINTVHIRLTFNPAFVDNTYGSGSIGWPHKRGHRFRDLVKSDHAEIAMNDAAGEKKLQFKLDYFSEDPARASGHGSLGVRGGDGSMSLGGASSVLKWITSHDRNFNERGHDSYTVDSPATDQNYTPNPAAPDWDYRVVYEAWVDAGVFGAAGFGGASIDHVHASPAKGGGDTVVVTPGECPPPIDSCTDGIPDTYCETGEPPDGDDPCLDGRPDTFCAPGGPPPEPGEPEPNFCREHPDDPACKPD